MCASSAPRKSWMPSQSSTDAHGMLHEILKEKKNGS
ncbi:hypothetical protein ACVIJW_000328 [Bradyrhizobium barranii subsp. barranii]